MDKDALLNARELLEAVTPLASDCGRVCGGACCKPLEGEDTGMLLFPGEEALYEKLPDFSLTPTAEGMLLRCPGHCRREERPLSCRLFPLLPLLRADGIHPATDQRGRAVCPLARQGKSALRQDFVDAVRQAGELLMQDPRQRRFLLTLTTMQDDLRALRKQLGGGRHV